MRIQARPRSMRPRAVLPALGAALLLAACGSPANSAAPAAQAAAAPAGDVVTVTMSDFTLTLDPPNPGPGAHTFHAVNKGKYPHSIVIDGPGVSGARVAGTVAPGASGDVTATLQAGSYDMYCPVGNHRSKGMETKFTAGGTAPAGAGGSGAGGY